MKRYDDLILGRLLDKYENSSLSRGENLRNISIAYKITSRELPEYFDERRLDFENVHSQLLVLEEAGLVSLIWRKGREGQILDKCLLVPERVSEAYRHLHRQSKAEKEERIMQMLAAYASSLPAFAKWVQERLAANASVRQYLDIGDFAQAERICQLASAIRGNTTRQFLRQFSVAVFHDSKAAEREIAIAARILADFESEGRLKGLETQEILEEYLIFKNPSWIFMKGGPFAVSFPGGIGVTEEDALGLFWDADKVVDTILTIENLTTFHQWEPGTPVDRAGKDSMRKGTAAFAEPGKEEGMPAFGGREKETSDFAGRGKEEGMPALAGRGKEEGTLPASVGKQRTEEVLVIYLGGYANRGKREFLRKLHAAYPSARFFHYGDIDCGGFRIWKTLAVGTGLSIEPFRMDLAAYRQNLSLGRPLTDHDKKTLAEMLEDPFFENQRELFQEMLSFGIKEEQESIR